MSQEISAFPLTWPPGWKRTAQRIYSPFFKRGGGGRQEITISQARSFLLDELRMMGISSLKVIISSDVKLRLDGFPLSGQPEPKDSGVSVWWSDGKSHKVIAIDKYNRVADNIYAVAKTIEALRGIDRWGSGEILQRTFTGFQALPAPVGEQWWEVIEVQRTAARSEVEAAYKRRRLRAHPDHIEGSVTEFNRVQKAWAEYLQERP